MTHDSIPDLLIRQHIANAIARAYLHQSSLGEEAEAVPGFCSLKVRHLLNNVVLDGSAYLEVGLMRGATLIAALTNHSVSEAHGFDNLSGFDATEQELRHNLARHLPAVAAHLHLSDCFAFQVPDSESIDVYFYDGDHRFEAQSKALTHFASWLAQDFIFLVDDWNWDNVREGTWDGIAKAHMRVVTYCQLPASQNGDSLNWWNGIFVGHLTKRSATKPAYELAPPPLIITPS